MLNTDRSTSNHDEAIPSGRKVKLTVKELMVMEKYEGEILQNEIEGLLDQAAESKKNSKESKSSK